MAVLEDAIDARLRGHAGLIATLASATSIYALQANHNEPRPYLTFEVVSDQPFNVMGTETPPTDSLVIVNIFTETFLELMTTFIQLRLAFKRYSGTEGSVTVQDTLYEGRNDNFDESDRSYQRTCNFRFFYEE